MICLDGWSVSSVNRAIVVDTNVSPFARTRNICCGHKFCVRDAKNVSDFVQKHLVSASNVSQFAQPRKHHEQQCVRNNVSSFARALRIETFIWRYSFLIEPTPRFPLSRGVLVFIFYLLNKVLYCIYHCFTWPYQTKHKTDERKEYNRQDVCFFCRKKPFSVLNYSLVGTDLLSLVEWPGEQ